MIRVLSGIRTDDAYGCMVLLGLNRPGVGNKPTTEWCPYPASMAVSVSDDGRGTITTRVCGVHEIGLLGEGRLLTSGPIGGGS